MLPYYLAGALVLSYLVGRSLWDWYRLRHIPGPFWAGFSKLWLLKHTWDGTMYMKSAEACFKYGRALFDSLESHVRLIDI